MNAARLLGLSGPGPSPAAASPPALARRAAVTAGLVSSRRGLLRAATRIGLVIGAVFTGRPALA